MQRYAIIVAGGSGTRMNADTPKQFILLKGKPILMHTIEAFANSGENPKIIVVLNIDYHSQWEELIHRFEFNIPHEVVKGGTTRFHSVKNGLKNIPNNSLVAVHDAVRPLTDKQIINNAYNVAGEKGNAVVAVKSKDSLRRMIGSASESVNREEYYLVQTPQVFKSDILQKAYQQDFRNEFTDDASVVERLGERINLVEGNYRNIKITFQEDLAIAEALLNY